MMKRRPAPPIQKLPWRKARCIAIRPGESGAATVAPTCVETCDRVCSAMAIIRINGSSSAQTRIQEGVEQIRKKRQQSIKRGDDKQDRLNDLDIRTLDGHPRQVPEDRKSTRLNSRH